jgi:hypothetical protein
MPLDAAAGGASGGIESGISGSHAPSPAGIAGDGADPARSAPALGTASSGLPES